MASLDELIRAEEQKTLAAYSPLANTPRHSLLKVLAGVRAGGRYLTQANIETLLREIFPDTASGEILREHWRDRVPPLDPTYAVGEVVFSGVDGTAIPSGSLWKHRGGQLYGLLTSGVVSGGQYVGRVLAQKTGSAGNLAAGEELALASSRPAGLDATATVAASGIGGGVDTDNPPASIAETAYNLTIVDLNDGGIIYTSKVPASYERIRHNLRLVFKTPPGRAGIWLEIPAGTSASAPWTSGSTLILANVPTEESQVTLQRKSND